MSKEVFVSKVSAVYDVVLSALENLAEGESVTMGALSKLAGGADFAKAVVTAIQASHPGQFIREESGRNAGVYRGYVPKLSTEEKKAVTKARREAEKRAVEEKIAEVERLRAEVEELRKVTEKVAV